MPLGSSSARALVLTTLALAAGAAGCSAGSDAGDGPVGEAVQASDGICNAAPAASLDGFPAYPWCNYNSGQFNIYTDNGIDTKDTNPGGWTETEGGYGYQCVEFAVRYFYFKWNVPHTWFIPGATDMCGTHPSGVSITSNPVHGDLAVITPGCGGSDKTFGHVFGIDSLNGTTINAIQQNPGGAYPWPTSCVQCYLHAANNGGTQDPCATATAGNGYYCGQSTQWGGGTPNVLYLCQNGVTQSMTPCQYGCQPEPAGTNDQCNPSPPDPCAKATSGNGYYCGQSPQWGGGTPDVLYLCQNGVTQSMTPCPYGCDVEPAGTNDQCNQASMSTSSSSSTTSASTTSSSTTSSSSTSSGSAGGSGGAGGSGAGGAQSGSSSTGSGHTGSSSTGSGHTGSTGTGQGSGASGTGGTGAEPPGTTNQGSGCAVDGAGGADGSAVMLLGLIAAALGLRREPRASAR